jgi:hypothetical protein
LEPGNPSMKSQIKALAADEGKFSFASCIYVLIFPEFLNLNFKLLFYSVIGPRNLKKNKKKNLTMFMLVLPLSSYTKEELR